MYILFEEHQYDSAKVENILKDIYVLQDVDKKVSVQYVGYFYNPQLRDCVFILPKVLLKDDPQKKTEVLAGVTLENGETVSPEQVLTPEDQKKLSREYRKFIYEFSVWVYRALSVFTRLILIVRLFFISILPDQGKASDSTRIPISILFFR